MKENEFEQVTVQVPEKLMRLIRDQNYFGCTPEKFFADSVKRSVSCELSAMPHDEMRQLEREYEIKSELVVDLSKATI